MKMLSSASKFIGLALLAVLASAPALAQGHGHDNQGHQNEGDYRQDNGPRPQPADNGRSWGTNSHREALRNDFHFEDHHRSTVNDYYGPRFNSGLCPPGLDRNDNGCQPRGEGRRWEMGRRLPRGLVSYPLPRDLSYRLPPPPRGQRYVRVGADILLITIGTSLVIDAIQDIGGY